MPARTIGRMVHAERVRLLNDAPENPGGQYVLYWMQASQRPQYNHALEYAAARANALGKPLVVAFGLMDDYPEATERHYAFMLEGLRDVAAGLRARRVKFVVRRGSPPEVAVELARRAALLVCDRGYLRHQRRWRDHVADRAAVAVAQVESDVLVPVETASDRQEYAARTLRPKHRRHWETFLAPLKPVRLEADALRLKLGGDVDAEDVEGTLAKLRIDRSVKRSGAFEGGAAAGARLLRRFLAHHLSGYAEGRREPAAGATSKLSAYLHFGQLSPVQIAVQVLRSAAPPEDRDAYLEELLVRRELAVNFVHYRADYDRYEGLPAWAKRTLESREGDARPSVYTRDDLERSATHDAYWNAAQRQMARTGFMHNSMRMYWGKKVLEWKRTPRQAYDDLLYLNNRYFLCGRDPNAYANVGWVFGLHDRPWGPARLIFGTVRYMNAAGLERKFDMSAYVRAFPPDPHSE